MAGTRANGGIAAALAAVFVLGSGCSTTRDNVILRYERLPHGAYAIVAEIRAKPGKEGELRAATLPLVAEVRGDPKNLLYFLHEDRENPGHFIFYEIFANREDFDVHNAMSYVQAWFAKLPGLADGSVKVTRMEILGN